VIVLSFLLAASVVTAAVFAYNLVKLESEAAQAMASDEQSMIELDSRINELTERARQLESERDEYKVKAAELESERESLISTYSDSDALYASLNAQIAELNALIAERDSEIEILNNSIETLERSYSIDINAQLDVIKTLEELLGDVPLISVKSTVTNPDGTTEERTSKRRPNISLYYEDIENGYTYSYRGDEVYDSASCIKAPYALSLIRAAEAELADIPEGSDLVAMAANGEIFYNFTGNSITYVKDMEENGTGKIKDGAIGTVYTHLQLLEYMLKYSDNVAYAQLKAAYGIEDMRDQVYTMGLTSMRKSMSNLSANDGGKIMRAIYDYMESDGMYSEFLYNSMLNSAHTVMIGYAVSPAKTAHKYGWDTGAYHDMAIVYDEHPFILVIMSDMDTGGDEINEYIQSVVDQVEVLHDNFYSSALNK